MSIEEFTAFARENNIPVVKASAQTGQNVDELFINLGRQILLLNRDHLSKIDESQMVGESFILREFTERENRRKRNAQLCCVLS